jgi:hypothetical protein
VDRKRWQGAYPVTFLTAPAGLRRIRLVERAGPGQMVLVQAHISVHSGQWRQLNLGPQTYRPRGYLPAFVDERGVDVNTAARRNRRVASLSLLMLLFLAAAIVVSCLLAQ